jgi:hypothetical protein
MKDKEDTVKDTVKYVSDGSTASYYVLPEGAKELQDLISHLDLNAQIGEIFRACYRYGRCRHSDRLRDAKKILFYAQAEVARLEALEANTRRGKPSWSDAPEWAQWLAQDEDGGWCWYEGKPKEAERGWRVINFVDLRPSRTSIVLGDLDYNANPDWRNTLEKRP